MTCQRIPIAGSQPLWVHSVSSAATSFKSTTGTSTIMVGATSTELSTAEPQGSNHPSNHVLNVALQRDVLTGVYEGGFKVWECTLDLIQYMRAAQNSLHITGRSVLEAGCGLGLPSVCALQQGASSVFLQDLNREVLETGTLATVSLNVTVDTQFDTWFGKTSASSHPVASFIAGDWDDLIDASQTGAFLATAPDPGRVDIILTAETIYAQPQIEKLARLIHRMLRRQQCGGSGEGDDAAEERTNRNVPFALVAAKRYYFGTDGGTLSFGLALSRMSPVPAQDCGDGVQRMVALASTTVLQVEDGQSNIREVLKVYWEEVKTC